MTPGIPTKLNIPKVTSGGSPKAAIAANLSGAKRATGASYGIFAQRSMLGSGVQYNNFAYNSAGIAETRRSLNANRPRLFNNVSPQKCNHNQDDTMNKFMMGMMAMQMLGQMTAQTMDTVNSIKAAKTNNYGTPKNKITNPQTSSTTINYDKYSGKDQLKLSKSLDAAQSFIDTKDASGNTIDGINTIENKLKTEAEAFKGAYGALDDDNRTNIQSALDGIGEPPADSGIQKFTIDGELPELTEIELTDLESFDKAYDTVGSDINAITGYESKGQEAFTVHISSIGEAKRALQSKVGTTDPATGSQITQADIQSKLSELDAYEAKIKSAQEQFNSEITALKTELSEQQERIADMRKTKAELADKKYDIAKKQGEDFKKNQTKMDKLNKDILKLKQDLNSGDANKVASAKTQLQSKTVEYNNLVKNMKSMYDSLNAAIAQNGTTEFKNSKNNTYKITIDQSAVSKYLTEIQDESSQSAQPEQPVNLAQGGSQHQVSQSGGNEVFNGQITFMRYAANNNVDTCQVGQFIRVGNESYQKIDDGSFKTQDGGTVSAESVKELLNQLEQQEQPSMLATATPSWF